jgi:hypothetical protein
MTDRELERWTDAWRQSAAPLPDLVRMARRERRLLSVWIATDWAVGVALLGFAAWIWFAIGTPVMRFAAAGIVLLTVAALAFTTLNWRGSFAGERASAIDFLALAERRSQARLRYIRFGWWVLAADLVVIAGAMLLEFRDEGAARLPAMLAMAALATAAAAAILFWWGRRERRRADRLAAMRQALAAGAEDPE